MAFELSLDELRARAARAALELSEEELQRLLPGVNRACQQARELRALIKDGDEPAAVFSALTVGKKKDHGGG
jgi:hypothetical protein